MFFHHVWKLQNYAARDYLLLLLFTGLRSNEAACIRCEHVDLVNGTILIPEAVSKNEEEYLVPLSDCVWKLLSTRRLGCDSEWLFTWRTPGSHISNIQGSLKTVKKTSGIEFCQHDLRRGFCSLADELSPGVVKELINHKRAEVPEGYTVRSTERLRRATQEITNIILKQAQIQSKQIVATEPVKPPTRVVAVPEPEKPQPQPLSRSITFEQLIYDYIKSRSIGDTIIYTYRKRLAETGFLSVRVVDVTDEMIEARECKLKALKNLTAIVIVQALSVYARMDGLYDRVN